MDLQSAAITGMPDGKGNSGVYSLAHSIAEGKNAFIMISLLSKTNSKHIFAMNTAEERDALIEEISLLISNLGDIQNRKRSSGSLVKNGPLMQSTPSASPSPSPHATPSGSPSVSPTSAAKRKGRYTVSGTVLFTFP
jgi:hypothetical protein